MELLLGDRLAQASHAMSHSTWCGIVSPGEVAHLLLPQVIDYVVFFRLSLVLLWGKSDLLLLFNSSRRAGVAVA